tara:strand:+ start:885 stop:1430 length:546 start_codon:yes stop_codon:yes gene_type:complete
MAFTKIASTDMSGTTTVSFTSGIDSTYKLYQFTFIDIHASLQSSVAFGGSINGGSDSYAVNKTSTAVRNINNEADNDGKVEFRSAHALADSSDFQYLTEAIKTDADSNASGNLYLFNPAGTTYAKHFMSSVNTMESSDYTQQLMVHGHFITTSAINAIQFDLMNTDSATFDAGTIELWGLS